ncbi:hypothetical protein MC885_015203 [Smutsia gigantea]|nr:hypothetical protein MC885_015203 [Smutsia gigantea]
MVAVLLLLVHLGAAYVFSVGQQGMIFEQLRICSMPPFVHCIHDLMLLKEELDVMVTDLGFGTTLVKLYQPRAASSTLRLGVIVKAVFLDSCVDTAWCPSIKFPVGATDCIAATIHFLKSLCMHGVDPVWVVLCGDSVGGVLAATICQKLLDQPDHPKIQARILVYSILQCLDFQLPYCQQNTNVPLLSLDFAFHCWCVYLDVSPSWKTTIMKGAHLPAEVWEKYGKWLGPEHIPERFRKRSYQPMPREPVNEVAYLETNFILDLMNLPLIAENEVVSQPPEACIVSCECDLLRDNPLSYEKGLEDPGVPVTWHHVKDGFHRVRNSLDTGCLYFPCSRRILNATVLSQKGWNHLSPLLELRPGVTILLSRGFLLLMWAMLSGAREDGEIGISFLLQDLEAQNACF